MNTDKVNEPYSPYILDELSTMIHKANIRSAIYVGSLGFEDRSIGALAEVTRLDRSFWIYLVPHRESSDSKGQRERYERQQLNRKKVISLKGSNPLHLVDCMIRNPQDAINEVLSLITHDDSYEFVLFDFSTMPTSIIFALFPKVWQIVERNLIAIYSLPIEYTTEPLFYEIGEPKLITGFHSPHLDPERVNVWIPVLGFQSLSATTIMKWGNFAKIFPIIAFPGYRTPYVDRVLYANKDVIRSPEVDGIYYASANNPLRTYDLIKKLLAQLTEDNVILSPLGPKPQSLGLCLAAVKHNLKVVYAQPWAYNPNYSMGYRMTHAYWLRKGYDRFQKYLE